VIRKPASCTVTYVRFHVSSTDSGTCSCRQQISYRSNQGDSRNLVKGCKGCNLACLWTSVFETVVEFPFATLTRSVLRVSAADRMGGSCDRCNLGRLGCILSWQRNCALLAAPHMHVNDVISPSSKSSVKFSDRSTKFGNVRSRCGSPWSWAWRLASAPY